MKEKRHLFDDPRNVKRLLYVLYGTCALLLLADLVIHRHADHPWEELFGFYGFYGFVACVTLVLVAKQVRRLLMRQEDHYDD